MGDPRENGSVEGEVSAGCERPRSFDHDGFQKCAKEGCEEQRRGMRSRGGMRGSWRRSVAGLSLYLRLLVRAAFVKRSNGAIRVLGRDQEKQRSKKTTRERLSSKCATKV